MGALTAATAFHVSVFPRAQAELAVREVEAVWAQEYQKSHGERLLRALDCYDEAFMFVRADAPRWAIQHLNEAAIEVTGTHQDLL